MLLGFGASFWEAFEVPGQDIEGMVGACGAEGFVRAGGQGGGGVCGLILVGGVLGAGGECEQGEGSEGTMHDWLRARSVGHMGLGAKRSGCPSQWVVGPTSNSVGSCKKNCLFSRQNEGRVRRGAIGWDHWGKGHQRAKGQLGLDRAVPQGWRLDYR
mgnify:FL=1